MAKTKQKKKPQKVRAPTKELKETIDTGWIIRAMVVIVILSSALFYYFNRKAKERYERTSAEQETWLAEEQSKINLACSGLLEMSEGHYALYANSDEGETKITDFDINLSGELINIDGSPLSSELKSPATENYTIKAISAVTEESEQNSTTVLAGDSVLTLPNKDTFLTAEATFQLATPSDSDTSNETSGIWFVDEESTLNLPSPAGGWRYAAWIVNNDDVLLIGKFSSADETIGKDFEADLRTNNSIVAIIVEPSWYEGSTPLPFVILGAEISESTQPGQQISLELAVDSLPYCVVSKSSPWL